MENDWLMVISFLSGVAAAGVIAWRLSLRWTRRFFQKEKKLLERTRRAEKLAELGALAGHLAHEIRNPLSTIKLNLQLLSEDITRRQKLARDGEVSQADVAESLENVYQRQLKKIQTVTSEADRLADTLKDFLQYAGKMELRPVRQDVNEILDDLLDFFEPQAQCGNVQLRRSLGQHSAVCRIDIDLFKQALLNLLINATQAMESSGGELIVKSKTTPNDVIIDVIDTGPGIDSDVQEHIFDAYFTTRKGGSGLGLPTCRRIIEEHGGHIELHSEYGKGSNFTIVLPLCSE